MDRDHIEYWPAYLQSVFAAVGRAMGERKLTPAILNAVPEGRSAIVAGHQVSIVHAPSPRGGPRTGYYVITITGGQINVCWRLRTVELETLSRHVDRAVGPKKGVRDGGRELGAEVW
jgi:hypothetical protein